MNAVTTLAAPTTGNEHGTHIAPQVDSTTTPSATTAHVATRPARRSVRTVTTARSVLAEGRSYYATSQARIRLLTVAVALTYGGGAAMFYLHAVVRGEQGPAIANLWHWLLDSSLGFVGLTPVLVVLLPLTAKLTRSRTTAYAAIGALFGLLTAPGPILHNLIAGADTPLARAAISFFGTDPTVAAAHEHAATTSAAEPSAISSVLAQIGVGLPTYITLAVAAGTLVHHLQTRTRTTAPAPALAAA